MHCIWVCILVLKGTHYQWQWKLPGPQDSANKWCYVKEFSGSFDSLQWLHSQWNWKSTYSNMRHGAFRSRKTLKLIDFDPLNVGLKSGHGWAQLRSIPSFEVRNKTDSMVAQWSWPNLSTASKRWISGQIQSTQRPNTILVMQCNMQCRNGYIYITMIIYIYMYMYIYIYVFLYICIYVYIYIYMYLCIDV